MPEKKTLRLFSWNVNGIRACGRKGFLDWLGSAKPDILGLQETRALPEQLEEPLRQPDGYQAHLHPAAGQHHLPRLRQRRRQQLHRLDEQVEVRLGCEHQPTVHGEVLVSF